jgi:hypothetical protein
MPTKAKGVPVSEMVSGANGCAAWLVHAGFTTGPVDADGLLFALTPAVNESVQAGVVLTIFFWLWCNALPPVDGRRSAEKERVVSGPPGHGRKRRTLMHAGRRMTREAFAGLHFGSMEHDLARKIRAVVRSIEALGEHVWLAADRQKERRVLKGQEDGTKTRHVFNTWLRAGRMLQTLIEPTGSVGVSAMPVPHTLDDWRKCRFLLELVLSDAEFSDKEILKLLPGGGRPKDVYLRRYNAQKVKRGAPPIEHRPTAGGSASSAAADGDQSGTAKARRSRGAGQGVRKQRAALDKDRATRKHSPRSKAPRPSR